MVATHEIEAALVMDQPWGQGQSKSAPPSPYKGLLPREAKPGNGWREETARWA